MKRFIPISIEIVLCIVTVAVWVRALIDDGGAPTIDQPGTSSTVELNDVPVAPPIAREFLEPREIARWFQEPRDVLAVTAPEPQNGRSVSTEPVPKVVPHVRLTGTFVMNGDRFISAVDGRIGRAILIGRSTAVADWVLVEEREDAVIVSADDELLAILRESQ